MKNLTCAFTGHRPNHFRFSYDETDLDCIKLKIALKNQILKMLEQGVTQFLSGMALGVDMWAANMVLNLKEDGHPIKLTCVLPCETQADNWQEEYRNVYFRILESADEVIYTNTQYTSTCMYERNIYLIEHADFLLAVYDGIPKGGTSQTVRIAMNKGIPVTIIHPNTLLISSAIEDKPKQKAKIFSFL